MSENLTPETLAEWDDDATVTRGNRTEAGIDLRDQRIRTLIRSLRDEKAAREEAERDLIESRARAAGLSDLAGEHKARADKAVQERDALGPLSDDEAQALSRQVVVAEARVAELEAGIKAVHTRVGLPDIHKGLAPDRCRQCNVSWPCKTVDLIDPTKEGDDGCSSSTTDPML